MILHDTALFKLLDAAMSGVRLVPYQHGWHQGPDNRVSIYWCMMTAWLETEFLHTCTPKVIKIMVWGFFSEVLDHDLSTVGDPAG